MIVSKVILFSNLLCSQKFVRLSKLKLVNIGILLVARNGRALTRADQYSSGLDAIDVFAEKIIQDKAKKWKNKILQKKKQMPVCNIASLNEAPFDGGSEVDLTSLANSDVESVNKFVSTALRDGRHRDVVNFLLLCYDAKRELHADCLHEAANLFARLGVIDGVNIVKLICKEMNASEYSRQGGYDHYLAEANWVCGNLQEAFVLFTSVYEQCPNLHKKLKSMSRFLVNNVMSRQGEAALVVLMRFAEYFATQHGDYHFLMVLWQFCFLSNWFADQTVAANLLVDHPELRTRVEETALEMCFILLKSSHSEVVYRLLEVLLKYKMRDVYSQVLRALFDYNCKRGDVQACSNIVRCCEQLSVSLTAVQQRKFIFLVIGEPEASRKKLQDQSTPPPEFKLKF